MTKIKYFLSISYFPVDFYQPLLYSEGMNIDIEEKIRILCIKKKSSLTSLAEKLGCTKQNLFIKLKRNDMKLSDICKMVEALGGEVELNFKDPVSKEILA